MRLQLDQAETKLQSTQFKTNLKIEKMQAMHKQELELAKGNQVIKKSYEDALEKIRQLEHQLLDLKHGTEENKKTLLLKNKVIEEKNHLFAEKDGVIQNLKQHNLSLLDKIKALEGNV